MLWIMLLFGPSEPTFCFKSCTAFGCPHAVMKFELCPTINISEKTIFVLIVKILFKFIAGHSNHPFVVVDFGCNAFTAGYPLNVEEGSGH